MTEERQPVKKVRCGKMSISLWQRDGAAFGRQRACIQHSRRDNRTGEWQNQQIWLNADELRDVANALDQMNEVGESPSSNAESTAQLPSQEKRIRER